VEARIGALFWPEASPDQLRRNLGVTLHHVRRALGNPNAVLFKDGRYSFNRDVSYWLDTEAFEAELTRARSLRDESPLEAIGHLKEAVRLYGGDFLEGFDGGDWIIAHREELRGLYLDALFALGQLLFAQERYADAAEAYRKLTAANNYYEAGHRELMRCYERLGERGLALRHYSTLRRLLSDELGAPPAAETTALFERLRAGEPA
jgi:DNA-binding SARP family transcriptional activator